jgi:hypothetical protein
MMTCLCAALFFDRHLFHLYRLYINSLPIQLYLADAFTYAASAIGAAAVSVFHDHAEPLT